MTSQGSPHARFRRALLTGNVFLVDVAARELGRLADDDAIRYVAVLAKQRDPRFDAAAARLAARIIYKQRLGVAQAHTVLALAAAMPAEPDAIATTLQRWVTTSPPECRAPGGSRL